MWEQNWGQTFSQPWASHLAKEMPNMGWLSCERERDSLPSNKRPSLGIEAEERCGVWARGQSLRAWYKTCH